MGNTFSFAGLPVIIALNAANLAGLVEKTQTLCGDMSWDWVVTTGVLVVSIGLGLAIVLLTRDAQRLALAKEYWG